MNPLDLPEHDPSLVNNRKTALRFTEMIAASPDSPEQIPWRDRPPRDPDDQGQPTRSSHVFCTRDDVIARSDPKLARTLTGPLDAVWDALDKMNRERRAGVFVVLDPSKAIVANFSGEPLRGFPVPPSFTVTCGWTEIDRQELLTYGWLLSSDMPPLDRADVGAQLRILGAKSVATREPALVPLPGTHTRTGVPTLVNFIAIDEAGLPGMTRYHPGELHRTFLGKIAADAA